MNITSTYDLFYDTLNYLGLVKEQEVVETETTPVIEKPHRKSATPYKDALMKGLTHYTFKNRNHLYYKNLGNKINKIVDKNTKKRPYNNWWVDDYRRESYLIKNNRLKKQDYCVVLSRKKWNTYCPNNQKKD